MASECKSEKEIEELRGEGDGGNGNWWCEYGSRCGVGACEETGEEGALALRARFARKNVKNAVTG